jgi:hypothetical protein
MPIDQVAIKPQPKPTSRPDISRQIKAFRVAADAIHILAEERFAAYRDDSITVMAIQVVREYLTAHSKVGVIAPNAPLAFWQRETNSGKSGKPWRFGVLSHYENRSRHPGGEVERRALTKNEGSSFRSLTYSFPIEAAWSLQPIVRRP